MYNTSKLPPQTPSTWDVKQFMVQAGARSTLYVTV